MPFEQINIGAVANDGTGDDPRTGGEKINNNFAKAVEGAASATPGNFVVFADASGKLVLDSGLSQTDLAEAPPTSPTFTYEAGRLVRIDYADTSFKTFVYAGSVLSRVDFTRDGSTVRKDFTYEGGVLTHISQTTL